MVIKINNTNENLMKCNSRSSPNVGNSNDAAEVLDEHESGDRECGSVGDVEATIAVQNHTVLPILLHVRSRNYEHRHLKWTKLQFSWSNENLITHAIGTERKCRFEKNLQFFFAHGSSLNVKSGTS